MKNSHDYYYALSYADISWKECCNKQLSSQSFRLNRRGTEERRSLALVIELLHDKDIKMKLLIIVKEGVAKQVHSIEEASCMQYLNGYHKSFILDTILDTVQKIKIPKLRLVKKEEEED